MTLGPGKRATPPAGFRVFDAAFSQPDAIETMAGLVRITLTAALDRITAAEVLALAESQQLRVGYRLHGAVSLSPAVATGHAEIQQADDATLRCHVVLTAAHFVGPPLLLHVGMLYVGVGNFEDWGRPGAWIAVAAGRPDTFKAYFASFNADRPQP